MLTFKPVPSVRLFMKTVINTVPSLPALIFRRLLAVQIKASTWGWQSVFFHHWDMKSGRFWHFWKLSNFVMLLESFFFKNKISVLCWACIFLPWKGSPQLWSMYKVQLISYATLKDCSHFWTFCLVSLSKFVPYILD